MANVQQTMSVLVVTAGFLALASCGGNAPEAGASSASAGGRSDSSNTRLATGAALSSAELAAAEKAALAAEAAGEGAVLDELKPGQIAARSDYASGAVVRKALAVRIPVYRFSNSSTGAHFFTTNTTERDNVIATMSPPFSHEGEAFQVASAFSPGLSPVHRFYNTQSGVHFYTISEAERANVAANMPQFHYEGVAYHASQVSGAGLTPFYRFYVPSKGFHFYTANEAEKDSIIANLSAVYSFEGIGYYVLDANWRAEKLPHTGITSSQCYGPASDVLLACSDSVVSDFNPQQDGHRVAINAMGYSAVGGRPLSSCVRDNVTGLVWEGKTEDDGIRDKDRTYTNQGGESLTDVSGYVASVNQSNLCGFSDWRLPSLHELYGLVDRSRTEAPLVNTTWLPNTAGAYYWTSTPQGSSSTAVWLVDFQDPIGSNAVGQRISSRAVRLVRGDLPPVVRYSFGSVSYSGDAALNLVNDAWTGLQWRRCLEGQSWSGSTCTGSASQFTHAQALAHARSQSGWRIPNIRELASLIDFSVSSGTRIDLTAFPDAPLTAAWSSSPIPYYSPYTSIVLFSSGSISYSTRNTSYGMRLVRINP